MQPTTRRDFLKLAASTLAAGSLPAVTLAGVTIDGGEAAGDDVDLVRRFHGAAATGNLAEVRRLLGQRAALIDARDGKGRTAFALALLAGHGEVAAHLRDAGYESDLHESALALDWTRFESLARAGGERMAERVNANHAIGGSAMCAAAVGGAGSDIWRVYAVGGVPDPAPGAKPDAKSGALSTAPPRRGATPLQFALRYPDLATAEMTAAALLANDADPDPPANVEEPPLVIAASRGSRDLVEMLIRLGANPEACDRQGRSAARLAGDGGHDEVAAMITRHETIPRTCRTSRTAADVDGKPYRPPALDGIADVDRWALVGRSHGNVEYVKREVARDPRLAHSVSTTSESAVEAGAHMGRRDIVDTLLERGAPYSLPTAVMRGDRAAVTRMLAEDPDRIHERGAHDFALLWYSVIGGGDVELARLLLDRGARVEDQHHLGTTALHWAVLRGPIAMVELFLESGADVNRVGRKFRASGDTPLALARRAGQPAIARLLESRGAT